MPLTPEPTLPGDSREPYVSVSISTSYAVPTGTVIERAPNGAFVGLRLTDGSLVKPWITLELAEDALGNDILRELGHAEQIELGISETLEFARDITGDIPTVVAL